MLVFWSTYPVVVRRNLEDENDEAMKNEVNDMIDSINGDGFCFQPI
jgi:hypothetical protein